MMPENHMKIVMFINKDVSQIIRAKQFDARSRFLDVTLLDDNGQPFDLTNCRIQFNARKDDGSSIMNDAAVINAKNGIFSVELTDQTLAIGDSIVKADISVFSNDSRLILTTRTFLIHVQATVRNDQAIRSSNEYNSVVVLFQDVWDMRGIIQEMNERFGQLTDNLETGDEKAGISALGGLNRIWNYLKTQSTAGIVETVNNIKNIIGNANPSTGNGNTVMNYLYQVYNRSPIKSVQRGMVRVVEPNTTQIQIDISTVNPAKCQVLLDGWWLSVAGSTGRTWPPYLYSLTATTLIIKGGASANEAGISDYKEFSWQVIEFN